MNRDTRRTAGILLVVLPTVVTGAAVLVVGLVALGVGLLRGPALGFRRPNDTRK